MPGDFSALRRQLRDLTSPQTMHDLHNLAGREVAGLIDEGFAREQDPDGLPWLPSKAARREGRKTLRDTGRLQDGIRWRADSRGVVVHTTGAANEYAGYHQRGTTRMPRRRFMPEPGALPLPYEARIGNVFRGYLRARYG